jgi:ferredoxin
MRVIAQIQKCIASGNCALTCPQVFEQRDEDGVVHVVDEHPSLALLARIRQVVDLCPAQVFRVENEDETGELTVVEDSSAL